MRRVRWLHLTDLHYGAPEVSSIVYGDAKDDVLSDLATVAALAEGVPDVVFFTGDLVFAGRREQFAQLDEQVFAPIRSVFAELDAYADPPLILPVPGNHDLDRKSVEKWALDAFAGYYRKGHNARHELLNGDGNKHRKQIEKCFGGYSSWFAQLQRTDPRWNTVRPGRIPGDYSITLTIRGVRLLVVGLNSAFLHLSDRFAPEGAPRKRQLSVEVEQLEAVAPPGLTVGDWVKGHDLAVLLTHHPVDWLHASCQERFVEHIARHFHLHVCGHVHAPLTEETRLGGGKARKTIMGKSFFGLRHVQGKTCRLHGYNYVSALITENPSSPSLEIWPRSLEKKLDGPHRPTPDPVFSLHPFRLSFTVPELPVPSRPASRRRVRGGLRDDAIRTLVQRVDEFRVFAEKCERKTPELGVAFDAYNDSILRVIQRSRFGASDDLVDVHILRPENIDAAKDDVYVMRTVGRPTQSSMEEWLAPMRLRNTGTAIVLVDTPPGVASYVTKMAVEAGKRGELPGVAIANHLRSRSSVDGTPCGDIEFYTPIPEGLNQYRRELVNHVYAPARPGTPPPYGSLLVAPIQRVRVAPAVPPTHTKVETEKRVVGTLNVTAKQEGHFRAPADITWAEAVARIWALFFSIYDYWRRQPEDRR